jgi:hypothetical protein
MSVKERELRNFRYALMWTGENASASINFIGGRSTQDEEKCPVILITCERPLDGAGRITHRDQTGGGEASNGLAGRVGGGVPSGEVVQTNEREESEREGEETVS